MIRIVYGKAKIFTVETSYFELTMNIFGIL